MKFFNKRVMAVALSVLFLFVLGWMGMPCEQEIVAGTVEWAKSDADSRHATRFKLKEFEQVFLVIPNFPKDFEVHDRIKKGVEVQMTVCCDDLITPSEYPAQRGPVRILTPPT